jgi:hypothetical protein
VFDLIRVSPKNTAGAFGVLLQERDPFAVTLERTYDWTGRLRLVKIPPGHWPCRRTYYYRGGYDTYEIKVPGHTRLLFHRGNVENDSEGCVLVGQRFGVLRGQPAILASTAGFLEFMRRTRGQPTFVLHVVDVERD